ncbi:TrkH family potassium uptake protein [Persicimonas caeni]|uniref:TrkH family potassium uptake protein n=1 Tax=Persicimonas caeni TaxID=2292766 RepID=UPI00143D3C77|nr:potassium transporter TrkG [Persicimonas caeni]
MAIFSIDMPEGYLGPANQLTDFGAIYAGALLISAVVVAAGLLRRVEWLRNLVPVAFSVNIGLFVPALVSDPLLAVLLIIWHLVLLTQHLFPEATEIGEYIDRPLGAPVDSVGEWWAAYGPPVRHLVIVSVLLTVAVIGFELSSHWVALTVSAALTLLTVVLSLRFVLLSYAAGQRAIALLAVPLGLSLVFVGNFAVALALVGVYHLLTLVAMVVRGELFRELLGVFFDHPAVLIAAAFVSIILLGTLLLTFPQASATGVPIDPLDALFTATSASCVTGLIVLDTPHDFSTFGHAVILGLIQVGGLGIMVLSTFAAVIIGGKLGIRGERALGQELDIHDPRTAYRLTTFIVISTFVIEAVGAALLAVVFVTHGYGWGEAVWNGVFHSISAFCNAGFALQSDSLMMFKEDPFALLVFSALITLGGLGFLVMAGAFRSWRAEGRIQWSVQAKIVALASVALVLMGWAIYLAVEWDASLAGLAPVDKVMNALFQSVTLRTAGFNSVDYGQLEMATVFAMLGFMYIGASPGSTGGGIKTTTAVVLLAGVRAIARGEPKVVLFKRRISQEIVYRSAAIAVVAVLVIGLSMFILLLTEDIPFYMLVYEVVSAVATVGLSIGATGELSAIGKFVIIFVMFVGRIGPLTLALLLGGGKPSPVTYPKTRLMVG